MPLYTIYTNTCMYGFLSARNDRYGKFFETEKSVHEYLITALFEIHIFNYVTISCDVEGRSCLYAFNFITYAVCMNE